MNGLKTQLMMFIVPVIAAAILLSSIFSFYASTEFLKAQKYEELHSVANTASMHIEQMLIDEMKFASIIATQIQFIDLLKSERDDENLLGAAQARLAHAQRIIGTDQEITIIDKNGKAVASTSSELIGKDQSQDSLFINSRERPYIKDAYVDENNRQLFGMAAPIFDNNKEYIGSVAIDIPSKRLDDATHEVKTIDRTEEIIVFNRHGYAITPIKRQQNTFLKLRPMNENLETCLKQGNSTLPDPYISSFTDYSGVEVIGTHAHIDTMGWCLVVKTDLSESLEPVNKVKNRIIAFSSLIFIFGLTILNLLSSSITNPINKLTEEVDSITHGNLDTRLERSRIKEIQMLTESLNRILSSLKLAILRKGITKEEIGIGEAIESKETAERALAEKLKQLDTVFSIVGDGIILIDTKDEKIIKTNRAACDMFGYEPTEMIGKEHSNLHPKSIAYPHKGFKELVTGKATRLYEFPFMRKDKTLFYADITARSVKYDQRPAIVVSFRDVTKRNEQMDSLEKQKESLESTGATPKLALYDWNLKTGQIEWSSTIDKMFGYELGGFKRNRKSWEKVLHPIERKRAAMSLNNHIKKKTPYDVYYRAKRKDGKYIWLHDKGSAAYDKRGRPDQMYGACIEVSPPKTKKR